MIWLTESEVISGVDSEIGSVNVIAFKGGFQELWMMNCAVLLEIELLVLC